jgi:hypothetical protein
MKHIIFETKEQYLNAIQAWKETCKDKTFQFTAEHFALYAIIRGKDPKKCFASPEQQSKKKLNPQGKTGNERYNLALHRINEGYMDAELLAPFQGKLTKLDLMKYRDYLVNGSDEEYGDNQLKRMGAM